MATVGRVVVDVDANIARLEKKIDKAVRRMDRFGRRTKGVDRAIRNLSVGIGSVGFTFFARSVVDAGNKMQAFERALTIATGSAAGAKKELKFLDDLTEEIGVNFETTASSFSKFAAAAKGSNLEGEKTREIFTSVAKAARVLNLSAADTQGIFRALEQMMSKGKVQAEELRGQLGERLPGAFGLAAKAMGVTTAELDKLLKLGKVTAESLLPNLARELDNLFGSQIAAASVTAAANIERFNNELFRSKVAVSEGLLPAVSLMTQKFAAALPVVTDFAEKIGLIFAGGQGFGAQADMLGKQIDSLVLERNRIVARLEGLGKPGAGSSGLLGDLARSLRNDPGIDELRNRLSEVNDELERLKTQQLEILSPSSPSGVEELGEIFIEAQKRTNDYGVELAKLSKRFTTAESKAAALRAQLARFKEDLSPEQIKLIQDEIDKIMTGGLEEIVITAKRRFTEPMKKQFDEIEEASRQAARNIQDAFAEFLFDPFEDGVKGMLRSFLDAIRRMVANKAASQLFGFLGGLFGDALGGDSKVAAVAKTPNFAFASGGSFGVGGVGGTDSQPVFFKASPNETVTVTKPGQSAGGGGISVVNNVEINGADPERSAEILAPVLERNREETIAMLEDMRNRRQF